MVLRVLEIDCTGTLFGQPGKEWLNTIGHVLYLVKKVTSTIKVIKIKIFDIL